MTLKARAHLVDLIEAYTAHSNNSPSLAAHLATRQALSSALLTYGLKAFSHKGTLYMVDMGGNLLVIPSPIVDLDSPPLTLKWTSSGTTWNVDSPHGYAVASGTAWTVGLRNGNGPLVSGTAKSITASKKECERRLNLIEGLMT